MLLNSEVLAVLQERGAFNTDRFSSAHAVEKQAGEYLVATCGTQAHDKDKYAAAKAALAELQLPSAEVFQILNAKPRTPVEVFLVVDSLDDRYGEEADDFVEKVLALVEAHFPKAAGNDMHE